MGKIPGIDHLAAVRALQKAGFLIVRQGKHVVMSDGHRILIIPRHDPVNAYTMGGIVRDAALHLKSSNNCCNRESNSPFVMAGLTARNR